MLIDELKALFKRENKAPKTVRTEVPVFRAKASYGLTAAQVSERFDAGWANTPVEPLKPVGQIVSDNVFTYFNMIFMILCPLCHSGRFLAESYVHVCRHSQHCDRYCPGAKGQDNS